jgi:hypothetical protein
MCKKKITKNVVTGKRETIGQLYGRDVSVIQLCCDLSHSQERNDGSGSSHNNQTGLKKNYLFEQYHLNN